MTLKKAAILKARWEEEQHAARGAASEIAMLNAK